MTRFASSSSPTLALLLLLVLVVPQAGRADISDQFLERYQSAVRLYESSEYEGSIKEFQMAYTLKQLPRLLLNIGQAHRKLGHAKDALSFYEFYLRVEPNPKPEIKAELELYIRQTRDLLAAAEQMKAQQGAEERLAEQDSSSGVQAPVLASMHLPASQIQLQSETALTNPQSISSGSRGPAKAATGVEQNDLLLDAAHVTVSKRDQKYSSKIYKKWWFWTILGVATASAVAGVVGATWPSVTSDPSGIPIQKTF